MINNISFLNNSEIGLGYNGGQVFFKRGEKKFKSPMKFDRNH